MDHNDWLIGDMDHNDYDSERIDSIFDVTKLLKYVGNKENIKIKWPTLSGYSGDQHWILPHFVLKHILVMFMF